MVSPALPGERAELRVGIADLPEAVAGGVLLD
jgi:hypothetical protein